MTENCLRIEICFGNLNGTDSLGRSASRFEVPLAYLSSHYYP